MDTYDALIVWSPMGRHRNIQEIPVLVDQYLKSGKLVLYAPCERDKTPWDVPLGNVEIILAGEEDIQEACQQREQISKRLKKLGKHRVEIVGSWAFFCLKNLGEYLLEEGFEPEINLEYSTRNAFSN